MWRHYVYIHRRLDTGLIFYVGKGSHKKNENVQSFERAFVTHKRNKYWKNIVNKANYQVEILCSCQTDLEAQKIEKELITAIGRKNLANMTDGGDGSAGLFISEERRKQLSKAASGPRTEAWINSIRVARKNGGNGGVVKKGDKLPENWRANIAAKKIGSKNPMFGKKGKLHHNSKLILNLESGIFYDSVGEAAEAHNVNAKTLYQYLDGTKRNKTALVVVDPKFKYFEIDPSKVIHVI